MLSKAKALCIFFFFSLQTQEQRKPFSPITENVTRADPSSTSAGRVRENSSEMVLSEEGRTQTFIPWSIIPYECNIQGDSGEA